MAADFHEVEIAGIIQETRDARSFVLGVPAALRDVFRYRAGQFLTFEIPWNNLRIHRSYSLASAPETDARPKVTVKRVDGGRASNWFNDTLHVGARIRVRPPEGRFLLKTGQTAAPVTLLGGGSGITPLIALAKSSLMTTRREVLLVYANRDSDSIIFREELELLQKSFPGRFRVHHHLDTARGFLSVAGITDLISGQSGSDHYICGPTPFMDTVEAALEHLGVSHNDRFIERFTSPIDPDRRTAAAAPIAPTGGLPQAFQVTVDGATRTVPYVKGATLLKCAQDAGVPAPSSCEDGYCGCCMAFLKSGKVQMATHEALTDAEVAKGWILPCQSRPVSAEPLAIDFDAKY
jgi:3-ketosteroid 9alpha-monooxygenase subunit B